jgi:hypothetical protein
VHRGTAQAGEQKKDRYHQQAVNLASAELRIDRHGGVFPSAKAKTQSVNLIRVGVVEETEA